MHKRLSIVMFFTAVICAIISTSIISAPLNQNDADWWAQATHTICKMEYEITTRVAGQSNKYHAVNREQNLRAWFDADGVEIVSRNESTPAWKWSWRVKRMGRESNLLNLNQSAIKTDKNRIEIARPNLCEIYENIPECIMQSLIITSPPAGSGSIIIESDFGENLSPQLISNKSIVFKKDNKTLLDYCIIKAEDASGKKLASNIKISENSIKLIIEDTKAEYPLKVSAAIKTIPADPAWIYESNQVSAKLGFSVATAGDVNGDGFSDVIVGAPYFDSGALDNGKVFLFYGTANGMQSQAAWTYDGPTTDHLGKSVSTAGDVNGDGYSDIIIGAPNHHNTSDQNGAAHVFHGSKNGLGNTPDWTFESSEGYEQFGSCVATAGDVNGDGFSDVIIGAFNHWYDNKRYGKVYLFYGSPEGLQKNIDWTLMSNVPNNDYGWAVATAGDVNGDGFADVLIGEPGSDSNGFDNNGRVYLHYGSDRGLNYTPEWTADGESSNAAFGTSVGTAGDINGDGYADIIVGAPKHDSGVTIISRRGAVYVYHGSPNSISSQAEWRCFGEQDGAEFGFSVATAGDVNGDGFADIVVGQRYYEKTYTKQGCAYLWHGSYDGLGGYCLTNDADWIREGRTGNAEFGSSAATAGDVNGDGLSDLIIGAPNYTQSETNEGAAFLYLGSFTNLSHESGWNYWGEYKEINLGFSVNTAGDVNGDGYADIIVGAPYYDSGSNDEGGVFVWYGSSLGPNNGSWSGVNWFARGGFEGAHLGWSVSTAGDVNGDGYSDIIAGMPNWYSISGDEGAAAVWYGSNSGIPNSGETVAVSSVWNAVGDLPGAQLGYAVANAGDVNGDGYGDIIIGAPFYSVTNTYQGIVCVWYGSDTGLGENGYYANADWKMTGNGDNYKLGFSVATAGDVNRDGYSDIIAGGNGYAAVWHGWLTGLPASGTNWVRGSFIDADGFGFSVNTAGDVNGDGFSDVIVGAPFHNNMQGAAYVFSGSSGGLPRGASWTDTGNASSFFGLSVSTAGDLNGDGIADIVIGAPIYSDEAQVYFKGQIRVYYGTSLGPVSYNGGDWVYSNPVGGSKTGYSVACAGDINGDGFADIIIGSPMQTQTKLNEGRIDLFYGNGGRGKSFLPRQLRSGAAIPIAPLGMSDTGYTFDLELTAYSPTGRGAVRWRYENKSLDKIFDGNWDGTNSWEDAGITGIKLYKTVTGLMPDNHYHWRVRIEYNAITNPFNPPLGRWIHMPWNGWNESDLRTYIKTVTREDIIQYLLTGEHYFPAMDKNSDGFIDVSDVVRDTK